MKTKNAKIQVRKRTFEYCLFVRLGNKPVYLPGNIVLVKEPRPAIDPRLYCPKQILLKNAENRSCRLEDSRTPVMYNQVHLLWLWTSYLKVSQ